MSEGFNSIKAKISQILQLLVFSEVRLILWLGVFVGVLATVIPILMEYYFLDFMTGLNVVLDSVSGQYIAEQQVVFNPHDPLLKERKILIDGQIDNRKVTEVWQKLSYLNQQDNNADIDLYISSSGGYVASAFAIIDIIHMTETPVNIWAIGGCHSACSIILVSGKALRYASSEDVIISIHANHKEGIEEYSIEKHSRERRIKLWKQHAQLPEEWFPLTGEKTYAMTAKQALEFGVIDEIYTPPSSEYE